MNDGEVRAGHWWIDRADRLCTDLYLGPPAEARVTGDALVIGPGKGNMRTFKRVPAP